MGVNIYPALSALERISDGVVSIDLKGQITYINQPAAKLLEITHATQTGEPISRVVPDENADRLEKKINQAIRQQSNIHFEIQTQSSQWLEVYIYPSEDGATVLLRNITPKKQIEETIQVQHERLQLLTEAANHLFYKKEPKALLDALFHDLAEYLDLDVYFNYLYDPDTNKIRLMNYSGIPETTAKEIEWLELGEAVCGCVARDRLRIVAEKIDTSDDVRVQLVKGWGIKAYACHPLMSYGKLIGTLSFGSRKRSHFTEEELDLIFTICQQVATTLERTFLIAELTEKKEEAEKANQAKSEFLSMISHELRTPLNSIMGFAQILEMDQRDPLSAGQKDKVQKLQKSSRHLLSLINDMIDIARTKTGTRTFQVEPVAIGSMVSECVKMIRPLADRKGIHVTSTCDDVMIHTDLKRVTQIVLNLLANAVKYTAPNGQVKVTCEPQGESIKLIVSDTGIGIPPQEQEKIFAPFYRIFNRDVNIEGAGIGLTIVKQFVEELQGEVGVKSELGKGSRFWFTIPNQR
ncbi:PAS domain S-box-containing protein [Bacillus sp. SLBN-46]|uniref:sensor histidine kinase n=1 Tax=Bacillus sp. SLBN-46 TaxID=3042283 RepID=UPI002861AA37|nr:ATP-binding protein [Bacillus sp. SLBN-46]MDR6121192.1 PAS domain S-box-containing protein [Bacillus sp. SLBN-46]